MQYLTDINAYQCKRPAAVTLGKFDSLHRGHQKLVEKVRQYASEGVTTVVCAFDMGKDSLLTNDERRERLEEEVDCLIECPFTEEIRGMEAEQFIEKILVEKLHAAYIVVGKDFHFGHEKRGDTELLEQHAERFGYHVDIIEKERLGKREISSTYVREALRMGNVALARKLLGYAYGMEGIVERGQRLGRTLGFPTMNVAWEKRKIAPRFGVYACQAKIEGKCYQGIGNVGVKPTVAEIPRLLTEVFLFGYEGDAYGKHVKIWFCEFERPEMKFSSLEELKMRVDADILYGKEYFKL